MLLKNTALLLVAAVLVLDIIPATFGQEASAEDTASIRRQSAQAARRTKLFEAQQQQQQEKVSAVAGAAAGNAASRRRLVSKTRVSGGRASTAAPTTTTTTEAPTTAPPTEAPIPVTEEQQRFTDFSSFVDSNVEDDDPEVEDEEIQFRPRATAAPVVVARTTTRAPVTAAARRPVSRPVVIALDDEEEEDPQPLPAQRKRPVAGPVRSRVQEQARPSADSIPRDTNAPALVKPAGGSSRTRTTEKPEIVETVRRYNFESEDGSFTFGYENADGSFKEETRRPDCIVIGKYGYIDPDGIKREFTYQTGNQCDPDAHKRQESSTEEEEEEEDEVPVRRPNVPARRPVNTPRPSAASPTRRPNIPDVQTVRRPVVQQQQQAEEEDESAEITQVLNTPTRISRPQTVSQPERSRPVAQPTPAARPAARPSSSSLDLESELDRLTGVQPQRRPVFSDDDDEEAFVPRRPVQQQVQQQQAPQPVRQPVFQPAQPQVQPFRQFIQPGSDLGNNPIRSFTSELVFDPRTNQFTSAFQQRIPETNEEININGNLGGFVFNPQTTTTPSPLRAEFTPQLQLQRPAAPIQQQQQNFFGPSVEDQERIRQQQEAQRQQEETQRIQLEQQRIAQENAASRARPAAQFPAGVSQFQPSQQPFFGVAPAARAPVSIAQRPTFATGQIDSFLSSLG